MNTITWSITIYCNVIHTLNESDYKTTNTNIKGTNQEHNIMNK